jgi:5-methylcytosine-specific restriction endonuclease McrA
MTQMTKKARMERAREIIDRNEFGVPFDDADLNDFSYVTGCTLRYACRRIDPNYATNERHVEVLAYDWEEPRGWSWRKAIQIGQIDIDRHMKARLTQAMRASVAEQIIDYAVNAEKCCDSCATTESLTVDHVWPPFSHLMSSYIDVNGVPKIEEDNGSGFKFSEYAEEKRWRDYHQSAAKLGILCRSCNSKKGVKRA